MEKVPAGGSWKAVCEVAPCASLYRGLMPPPPPLQEYPDSYTMMHDKTSQPHIQYGDLGTTRNG